MCIYSNTMYICVYVCFTLCARGSIHDEYHVDFNGVHVGDGHKVLVDGKVQYVKVFRGTAKIDGAAVAIKVLPKQKVEKRDGSVAVQQERDDFQMECNLMVLVHAYLI